MLWTYEISSGVGGEIYRSVDNASARICKVCARSRRGRVAYMHLHGGLAHISAHVSKCRQESLGTSPRSRLGVGVGGRGWGGLTGRSGGGHNLKKTKNDIG